MNIPTITDWLMVLITGVYVLATIFICWANIKAANASKAQLEEMKKQAAEENRPIIETELHYKDRHMYVLRFRNHGKQTAQHVKICLNQEFIDSLNGPIKPILQKQRAKECIIGVGQYYDLYIGSNEIRTNPHIKPITGDVFYEGCQNSYSDKFFVDIENYMTFFSSTTTEDKMLRAVQDNAAELKSIRQELHLLQKQRENQE